MDFKNDPRFRGIRAFSGRVWLSSPTMHGEEQRWVDEAIATDMGDYCFLACFAGMEELNAFFDDALEEI